MNFRPFRLASLLLTLTLASLAGADLQFKVSYDKGAFAGPFSGRIVVYLTKGTREPRFGPDWENPEPMFSAKFNGIMPDQVVVIDSSNATSFPAAPSALTPGEYSVQAVVDRNLGGRALGTSPGNLYSKPQKVELDPAKDMSVDLKCDQVVPKPVFKETEHVKLAEMQSKLLSKFYGRPTFMHAAIVLPAEWATEPEGKFPLDIDVPGFGGSYMDLSGRKLVVPKAKGVSFIDVYLDPNCPTGHCVFADSANNGPWGKALTTEFLPYIEKKFRGIGKPGARYIRGHSSGGWSSLWLQVEYPDFFGGVFSTAPDPVDFHAFQLADIYDPATNFFRDSKGEKIPIARFGGGKFLYAEDFTHMEAPIRGEQLGSFNAVFSPRGADGEPLSMWDPKTGAVVPAVAEAWKKYDIALKLRNNWKTLGPKLKGKLHVWVGTEDTFYLDLAVRRLAAELKELGSDAEIGFVPGNHFTMMTKELQQHLIGEQSDAFLAWQKSQSRRGN